MPLCTEALGPAACSFMKHPPPTAIVSLEEALCMSTFPLGSVMV